MTYDPNLSDLHEMMQRFSVLIDEGLSVLREAGEQLAVAERDYRVAKAEAWIKAPEGTALARQAWVDGQCARSRHARDLADYLRTAALEAIRARRTQLSAGQSLMAAYREDAALARTGPS